MQANQPQNANETVVFEAMTALFGRRDTSIIPKYWAETYVQHNPSIPDGRDDLAGIINSLPASFKYEPGFIASKDDLVFIHGRYEGWGPKPMLAVDIFKVENGLLVEHWDVMQVKLDLARAAPYSHPTLMLLST